MLPVSEFASLNVIFNFEKFACSSKISAHSQINHLKAEKSEPAIRVNVILSMKGLLLV